MTSSFFKILFGQGPAFNDYDQSSWFLLAIASIMLVVMLLNLLIAMFSKTFEDVRENSSREYQMQMVDLSFLWSQKPFLPPPLNVIIYVIEAIAFFLRTPSTPSRVMFQMTRLAFERIVPQVAQNQWKEQVVDLFYSKIPEKYCRARL